MAVVDVEVALRLLTIPRWAAPRAKICPVLVWSEQSPLVVGWITP